MKKLLSLLTALFITIISLSATANSTVTMYAPDGRSITVNKSDIAAWKAVGWYEQPFVTMYAPDGRTISVAGEYIEAYENVGWYKHPVMTLYTLDGRSIVAYKHDLSAWKAVGWYEQPAVTMYALDGRTISVAGEYVEAYKKVGWYTTPQNVDYKPAYAKILKNVIDTGEVYNDAGFSLIYIDGDDIPELVYCVNSCHAAGADIYTFYNGKAVNLSSDSNGTWGSFGSNGSIYYKNKSNIFLSTYYGMGYGHESVYTISDGKAVRLCDFNTDDNNPNKSLYYINENKVSYSEYAKAKSQYGYTGAGYADGFTCSQDVAFYPLTYQSIKNILG